MDCDCANLGIEFDINSNRSFSLAVIRQPIKCHDCGKLWLVRESTDRGTLVLKPASNRTPLKPAAPDYKLGRDIADHWKVITGRSPPEHVPLRALDMLAKPEPNRPAWIIGLDIAALAVDRAPGPHAAMTDDDSIRNVLAHALSHVECHSMDWRPPYGSLFYGIAIGIAISSDLLQYVKRSLMPGGGVFLFGDAIQHGAELAEAWGYIQVIMRRKSSCAYLWLRPASESVGYGVGSELSGDLARLKFPSCQQCLHLAARMNKWGVVGCRDRMVEIEDDMLPRVRDWWFNHDTRSRLDAWFKSRKSVMMSFTQVIKYARVPRDTDVASAALDDLLRLVIREQVEAAISRFERKKNDELCVSAGSAGGPTGER